MTPDTGGTVARKIPIESKLAEVHSTARKSVIDQECKSLIVKAKNHLSRAKPENMKRFKNAMTILHFSFVKNDANRRETVKLGNMSKSRSHNSPMRGVLSMLALSIDHIDPGRPLRPPGDPKASLKHVNYWDFHFLRLEKKTVTKTQKIQHFCFSWSCTASGDAMRVSTLKWGSNQPKTMSLKQLLSIFIEKRHFYRFLKRAKNKGKSRIFVFLGVGCPKKHFFFAQNAPNLATLLEKVIPIRFQASILCKTRFTHRGPLQPPDQTKIAQKNGILGQITT